MVQRASSSLITRHSRNGQTTFFDPAQFPWVSTLESGWSQVRVLQLPYGYVDTDKGPSDIYGPQGGDGVDPASQWNMLRVAGATARWLLVEAAAREWSVASSTLRAERICSGDM